MQDWFNDFQRIVRSDDIEGIIDREALRPGRDVDTPEIKRQKLDVLGVVDAIKASDSGSYPALIRLAAICASLTEEQFALFTWILGGGGLTKYAMDRGVSRAAVHRQWGRIVAKNPSLKDMTSRRRR